MTDHTAQNASSDYAMIQAAYAAGADGGGQPLRIVTAPGYIPESSSEQQHRPHRGGREGSTRPGWPRTPLNQKVAAKITATSTG